ncbi:MAG: TerB family tellurite resistance protein [Myxococcales bacterium]|nr:TerB family tellurite resistance protein [Myxococcales bacterium]
MSKQIDPALLPQLGFLFLTFGQVTDNHLDAEELKVIADRLRGWAPPGTPVKPLLADVVAEYRMYITEDERRLRASDCAHALRDALDEAGRRQVVLDVVMIARADGRISDGEIGFVSALTSIFGIQLNAELELRPRGA